MEINVFYNNNFGFVALNLEEDAWSFCQLNEFSEA